MGRPKEPLERMLAKSKGDGRTPGKREIEVVEQTARSEPIPVMPDTIVPGSRGEEEWFKIWDAGWWLSPTQDYHMVERISVLYNDMHAFRAVVAVEGLTVTGYAKQLVAHPLIAEIRKCEAMIQKTLSIIGFTPTDRAKLHIKAEQAKTAGLKARILAQRVGK